MAWLNTDIWHKCYIHVQVWELSVKKGKKNPKTCGFKSSKLTFRFFFPTCMRFELNRFVHNILFNFSTIFPYFTVQKRQTSGIKVFGINVIQCTCIQVWELSPLPHHYIFIRTLTKASNCCSTTSQTILDLSPLVGDPPFTTLYREIIYRLVSDMR